MYVTWNEVHHLSWPYAPDSCRIVVTRWGMYCLCQGDIATLIMDTLRDQNPVGMRGGAQIFDVAVGDMEGQLAIVVGSNGFVVTAYPFSG